MEVLESRRFDESYAKEYFYYHEIIKPRDALKFQIVPVFDFYIPNKDEIINAISHLHIQSDSSSFHVVFKS